MRKNRDIVCVCVCERERERERLLFKLFKSLHKIQMLLFNKP